MSQDNPIRTTPSPRWSLSLPYWSTAAQPAPSRAPREKRRPLLQRLRSERRARRRSKGAG